MEATVCNGPLPKSASWPRFSPHISYLPSLPPRSVQYFQLCLELIVTHVSPNIESHAFSSPCTYNASTTLPFSSYKVTNGGRGYEAGRPPAAKIEAPPFLTDTARATTTLKRSGSVFRVALRTPGKGYETAPAVTISPPR